MPPCTAPCDDLARKSLVRILRMSDAIVVMLYVKLGMFLAGLGCLTLARIAELTGESARTTRELRGQKPLRVLSRVGA